MSMTINKASGPRYNYTVICLCPSYRLESYGESRRNRSRSDCDDADDERRRDPESFMAGGAVFIQLCFLAIIGRPRCAVRMRGSPPPL